ncbi:hypothetical protein ACEPAH_6505 [Sanghuangporus vaninii]
MHPVANKLYYHLDAYTMLQSLPSLCVPLSLLLGTAVLAKATIPASTVQDNSSSCSCKRRRHEDSDPNPEDESANQSRKKARLAESSSLDEVELFLCDTTLVDKEHDDGAERISKPVSGSLFIPSSITPSKLAYPRLEVRVDTERLLKKKLGGPTSSRSVTLSSNSPYRYAKHKDEFSYDPLDARHEWELRWFVCAHHAAFTAATAMSLRREIRRRKTLSRMWRDIRKENIALKEDVKKLTFELHGFVEL